jgi:hypothetical protein
MSKYTPLANFLSSLNQQRWQLTFAEVESILGFSLPPSAYRYPAWWANDATGHSHAAAWLEAGWKTENVDVPGRRVTLVRQFAPAPGGNKFGCMKGTAWLAPDADLTAPSSDTFLAEDGKLLSE